MDRTPRRATPNHPYYEEQPGSPSDSSEMDRRSPGPPDDLWIERPRSISPPKFLALNWPFGHEQPSSGLWRGLERLQIRDQRQPSGRPGSDYPESAGQRSPSRGWLNPFNLSPEPTATVPKLQSDLPNVDGDAMDWDYYGGSDHARGRPNHPVALADRSPVMPPSLNREQPVPLAPSSSGGSSQSSMRDDVLSNQGGPLEPSYTVQGGSWYRYEYQRGPEAYRDSHHVQIDHQNALGLTENVSLPPGPPYHHTGGPPEDSSVFAPPESQGHAPPIASVVRSDLSSQDYGVSERRSFLPPSGTRVAMSTQNFQMICATSGASNGRIDWRTDAQGRGVHSMDMHGHRTSVRITSRHA